MSWEPINLAHIEDRPPVRPTIGQVGLVYPGRRHVFSGPQESAKTMAAYAIALEEARVDGTIILIDLEMGQWDARDRLRDMGATDDDLDRILYVEPETTATTDAIAALLDHKPTLVIIDAAAGAYSIEDLDDNKRADAERFTRLWVRPFWQAGSATIVIDHVTKNADTRGKYVIGSERKVGGVDVHLGFETKREIKRGGHGLYKITTHKDRAGWLPRPTTAELELTSDPETYAIGWTFREPAEHGDPHDDSFRPTFLMERVSRYLEPQPAPVSRATVEDNVTGRAAYTRLALDVLKREGYTTEAPGPRKARLVTSIHRYREDEDTTSSDLVPTSSGTTSNYLVPRPLSKRDEDEVGTRTLDSDDLVPTGGEAS